jgi:hypothetical protein
MRANKRTHQQHGGLDRGSAHQGHGPYWKRAHRHWGFWVALFLMFAAMIVYVMSNDLTLRPHKKAQQPLSGAVGK